MKNKKRWLTTVIIALTVILFISFAPINIQIGNYVIRATYFKNPKDAYYDSKADSAYWGPVDIVKDITVIDVSDEYSVYIAVSSSKNIPNGLIVNLMKRNSKNKYYYMGTGEELELPYVFDEPYNFCFNVPKETIDCALVSSENDIKKFSSDPLYKSQKFELTDNNNETYIATLFYKVNQN